MVCTVMTIPQFSSETLGGVMCSHSECTDSALTGTKAEKPILKHNINANTVENNLFIEINPSFSTRSQPISIKYNRHIRTSLSMTSTSMIPS